MSTCIFSIVVYLNCSLTNNKSSSLPISYLDNELGKIIRRHTINGIVVFFVEDGMFSRITLEIRSYNAT
jgi:hypothetical protein